jgi:hypothetical protein
VKQADPPSNGVTNNTEQYLARYQTSNPNFSLQQPSLSSSKLSNFKSKLVEKTNKAREVTNRP